ncbi:MAG TPA: hypothetical protein VKM54_06480 [Myxococcota bacterium]|nr:hypothetical protein [Myxococcota bacterium]
MEKAYKVCPGCESEYLPSVEVCRDCGLPLVWEGEARKTVGEDGLVLPPGEGLVLVRETELGWAIGLGKALARAGIPHRLDPGTPGSAGVRWAVSVGAADAAGAAAVDADYARSELPELETAPSELGVAPPEDCCPACGEPVAGDAGECPGCGLVFGPAQ